MFWIVFFGVVDGQNLGDCVLKASELDSIEQETSLMDNVRHSYAAELLGCIFVLLHNSTLAFAMMSFTSVRC